ncbi:spondin domain-containing protein [soil metagenome]
MFVQSNDLFYAPDEMGIPLFKDGNPLEGDITEYLLLWDAGTEDDQTPGEGNYQAPRQESANMGPEENGMVHLESEDAMYTYPANEDVIKVTSQYMGNNKFEITIMNVSDASTLPVSGGSVPVPLSPGVFVVHSEPAPLFENSKADKGMGLEQLAEDGNPMYLAEYLEENTGYVSSIAPGVFAEHIKNHHILFEAGQPDFNQGLEALAEDANPEILADNLNHTNGVKTFGVFNIPEGASSPGPILPGASFEFKFLGKPGFNLSFATMLGQSNDLFFAPDDEGIPLFNKGKAISGDITGYIKLWDSGTEVNEFPGAGNFQAPRQPGPDSGMDENGVVQLVNDPYDYPAVADMIKVTIIPD